MASKAKVTLIAAVANHGVIGVGNTIPWHIKADLFFFQKLHYWQACHYGEKYLAESNQKTFA